MLPTFKKLLFTVTFNSCLFFLLIIGIQNNTNKSRVNLLIEETVSLPVGFIIGSSFMSGSMLGSLLTLNFQKKEY